MTDERITEIEARANAATPGLWTVVSDLPTYAVAAPRNQRPVPSENQNEHRTYGQGIHGGTSEPNAEFIAAVRTDVSDLIAALREARETIIDLESAVKELRNA